MKNLTAVQDKLTKAGNLEEALQVRDAIAAAKAPSRATTNPGTSGTGGGGSDNVMAADAIQLGKANSTLCLEEANHWGSAAGRRARGVGFGPSRIRQTRTWEWVGCPIEAGGFKPL